MKKKFLLSLSVILAICMAMSLVVFATNAQKQSDITYRAISIYVNGTEIAPVDINENPTEPFILNSDGSTYLPVRAVADALGLNVGWDNATSTVILESDDNPTPHYVRPAKTNVTKKVTLYYRDIKITLDGKRVPLFNAAGNPVEPFIYNNSTYLPVRAVATALGCDVQWDGATSSVFLAKGSANPNTPSNPNTPGNPNQPGTSELKIVTEPQNMSAAAGSTNEVAFTVAASGGETPYTYKWQWSENNGSTWSDIKASSAKTSKLLLSAASGFNSGVQLHCIVTDNKGKSVTSRAAVFTIGSGNGNGNGNGSGGNGGNGGNGDVSGSDIKIAMQPSNVTVSEGGTFSLSVAVSGGKTPYRYQWYKISPNGTKFKASGGSFSGDTTSTLKCSYATAASDNGYKFYCMVIGNDGNSVESNTALVTVSSSGNNPSTDPNNPSDPGVRFQLTKNPRDTTMYEGSTCSLSVVAAGGTAPYTYEWHQIGKNGKDIIPSGSSYYTGVNTATLTLKKQYVDPDDGLKYYCIVRDAKGQTIYSTTVTVTVKYAPLVITTQPVNQSCYEGGTVTLSVGVTGGKGLYTYEWYRVKGTTTYFWGDKAYYTTVKYMDKAIDGSQFYCVITDEAGQKVTSSRATVTMY